MRGGVSSTPLWQHFGHVARGRGKEGVAIMLVEKKDTNEERAAKQKTKIKEGIGKKEKSSPTRWSHSVGRLQCQSRDGGTCCTNWSGESGRNCFFGGVPSPLCTSREIRPWSIWAFQRKIPPWPWDRECYGWFYQSSGWSEVSLSGAYLVLSKQSDTWGLAIFDIVLNFSRISCIPHSDRRLQALWPNKSFWL